jgi:hypothetical protein
MGGRLFDWLGASNYADRPADVDMPALLVSPGSTAIHFSLDTKILGVFDESGPAWFDIDAAALAAIAFATLPDVDWTTPPTDGQIFRWDNTAGKLVPYTIPPIPTSEDIMDVIGTMVLAGVFTGITPTYDDAGNALGFAVTITQYTNEMSQDALDAAIAAGTHSGIEVVYDDALNKFSFRNSRFMIPFWFEAGPTADEVLGRYSATDAFTIPANLVGSKMAVETAPTADYTILLKRQVNGAGAFATIATIVILAAGGFTLTTAGGVDIAIAVNDVIKIVGAHTPDTTLAGGSFNIRGH